MFCTMSPAATDLYVAVTYLDEEGVERYAYAMVPSDAPDVVINDDWDALGMRASGSNSVSLEGVELPESGVRAAFAPATHWPYMERNLVAGLFHAAASASRSRPTQSLARAWRGASMAMHGPACSLPTTPSTSPPHAASSPAHPPSSTTTTPTPPHPTKPPIG
jgi:alkylation response protein AidB-like acyl-CoA dehydrogenase